MRVLGGVAVAVVVVSGAAWVVVRRRLGHWLAVAFECGYVAGRRDQAEEFAASVPDREPVAGGLG